VERDGQLSSFADREKVGMIREACRVFDIVFGRDVIVALPNAT
jgi:hypothetical protein